MAPPPITVAVITYRRPDELASLLDALAGIERPAGSRVEVVVVDNDPDGSAAAVVAARFADHPLPLHLRQEERPGVAHARNAALRTAQELESGYIAFIDDDEIPSGPWLVQLLDAVTRHDAHGAAGPVVSEFDPEPPAWIRAALDRPRHPDGTPVHAAATNNLLLSLDRVATMPVPWFDERFGLSGGEDTDFTTRFVAAGNRLVWADGAVVTEAVPADRATTRWVLRRAFRTGNTAGRLRILGVAAGASAATARLTTVGAGVGRIVGGAATAVVGAIAPHRHPGRGLWALARGVGMVAAAAGYVERPYGVSAAPGATADQPPGDHR